MRPRNCSPGSPGGGSAGGRGPGEEFAVEVKIGVQSVPRELVVETAASAEEIEGLLRGAIADGGEFILRHDKSAYLELGSSEPRRVGFSNLVYCPAVHGPPGGRGSDACMIVDAFP